MTEEPKMILLADPLITVQQVQRNDSVTGIPITLVEMRLTRPKANPRPPDIVVSLLPSTARELGNHLVECSLGMPEDN